MAASSSSSSSHQEKYDVFLSFRGEDTRDGFTGYLYDALCRKHILTYKDDENLESGHRISEIMEAIRESKFCIIVFSEDFASSTWCLDEVVRILECKRDGNDVIPIFYGIEPSIVRNQKESYAASFAKHEQRFQDNIDKVQKWRDALKEVAGMSGYDSKNIRPEYKFIEKIVEDILLKLSKYQLTNDHFKRHLIGIEEPMKEIEGLLCIGSMDVRIIVLYGMGGIGKTTLARAVFRDFYHHFESYCFLNEVREEFERHGIYHLREKLLFELFKDKTFLNMESTLIQDRCRRTKVLIVLDDLDSMSQFRKLLPNVYNFGHGSRIIVTTRDAQMLKSMTDKLYEVKRLNDFEALKLFRLHAFEQKSDLPGYEALSKSAADYAHGNPLALEVLGSSLYSKSIKEWESALYKLEIDPDKDIQKVLRISYDGLGNKGIQDIFLDIACFFDGDADREYVESILHRTQHSDATIGISVLIDKSLIIDCQKRLSMHALLRQMGKAIVCDENKEPGSRSRLWKAKDIRHILERTTGSSEVEGILLNQSELSEDVNVKRTAFSKMYHLRFLRMHSDVRFSNGGIDFEKLGWEPYNKQECKKIYLPSEGIEYLSDELRYLQWDSYPLKDLPSKFSPKNLIELVMRDSQLVKLVWNEDQPAGKLKKMDLSYSMHLIQIPNLCRAINLESINLQGCTNLVQVPSSFKNLEKLQFLDLSDCESLKHGIENLPLNVRKLKLCRTAIEVLPLSMRCLLGLLDLDMSGCDKLKYGIENLPLNIKKLRLCGTAIETVPSSIGCLLGLSHLDLYNCKRLIGLPTSIWKLKSLGWLDFSNCPNLEKLFIQSSSLRYLKISGCTGLKFIIELPSSLSCLDANNCTSLETVLNWRTPTAQDYGPQRQNNKNKGEIYNFEHCLKLDDNSRNNVIADGARRRILSAQDDISYLEVLYPGDKIPKWFRHRTYSLDSIFVNLTPNWFNINDPRFKFVFCAVFVFHNSGPETKIRFQFSFTTNSTSRVPGVYNYEDACTLQVNYTKKHVLIRYATIDLRHVFGENWSTICSKITRVSFRVFMGGEKFTNSEIKECGLELELEALRKSLTYGEGSQLYSDRCSGSETLYPGNKIPEWFRYKNDYRNSILIHLNPYRFNIDDPLFKFVFCVVVSGLETRIRFKFEFRTDNINGVYNYEDAYTLQVNNTSEHVLIRYAAIDLRHVFGECWSTICSKVTRVYFRVFMEGEIVTDSKIKKCGLEWELEPLRKSLTHEEVIQLYFDRSSRETLYPGNKIPEWFRYKNDYRNAILIHLNPSCRSNIDDPFFNFFCCVVFVSRISRLKTKIRFKFEFATDNINGVYNYEIAYTLQVNNTREHVLIRYATIDLRHVFRENWSTICSKVTSVSFLVGEEVTNLDIIKFGLEVELEPGVYFDRGEYFDEGEPSVCFDQDASSAYLDQDERREYSDEGEQGASSAFDRMKRWFQVWRKRKPRICGWCEKR